MRSTFAGAFNYLLGGAASPEDNQPSFLSKVVSYGLSSIGFVAGITFLEAACDAANDTEPGCTLFQVGTVISYGLGAVWMIGSAISRMQQTPKEAQIVANSKVWYKVSQHVVANTLSVINTVIPAYISYKFNDDNRYYLLISVPVSYAFNAFAFYSLTDIAFFRHMILRIRTGTSSASNRFSQDINQLIVRMMNAPEEDCQDLSRKLFQIANHDHGDAASSDSLETDNLLNASSNQELYGASFLTNILKEPSEARANMRLSICRKLLRLFFQAAFLVFPLTNIFVNKPLSRQAVELLFDNEIAILFFSSIMVGVSAVIDTIFAVKTAGAIHDAIARKVTKEPSGDYLVVKRGKLAATFTLLSLVLAGLSSSSRIHIAKKTVHSTFIVVCAGVNATIFEWYAQRDLCGRFFESGIRLFDGRDSRLVRDVQCLRTVNAIVVKTDPSQLDALLVSHGYGQP